ncbi:MAG: hypothetical protein N2Z72_02225 [Bacteroidales bacterium]|nr:hypothetical protein [Bacteroidales bacterium]
MNRIRYLLLLFVCISFFSCNEREKEQKEIKFFEDSIKKEEQDLTHSKKAATEFITQSDSTTSH